MTLGFFENVIKTVWATLTTAIGLLVGTAGFIDDHLFGDGDAAINNDNGGITTHMNKSIT